LIFPVFEWDFSPRFASIPDLMELGNEVAFKYPSRRMADPQEPSGQGHFPPPYSLCADNDLTLDSSIVEGNIYLSSDTW
jgi:hypothetical protein